MIAVGMLGTNISVLVLHTIAWGKGTVDISAKGIMLSVALDCLFDSNRFAFLTVSNITQNILHGLQ